MTQLHIPSRNSAPALLVALAMLVSGCAGGGTTAQDTAGPSTSDPFYTGSPTEPGGSQGPGATSAPTTRPTSNVKVDPNGTFEGGAHTHDWWAGDTQVVIMDKDVPTNQAGTCIGAALDPGCGAGAVGGTTYFGLDPVDNVHQRPNTVYQGTGKMEIKVTVGLVIHPFELVYLRPDKAAYQRGFKVDQASKTFLIEGLNESATDPPHFRESQWKFGVFTTSGQAGKASAYRGPLHVTITIFRDLNRELPVDPPHPDYWNGATYKLLHEQTLSDTSTYGSVAGPGGVGVGAMPVAQLPVNATITIAAARLVVTLSFTNSYAGDVSRPGLQYCPASGRCDTYEAQWFSPSPAQDTATLRVYDIQVRPDQWDSPYETRTAWRFDAYHDGPADQPMGAFKGSITWKFELHKVT